MALAVLESCFDIFGRVSGAETGCIDDGSAALRRRDGLVLM